MKIIHSAPNGSCLFISLRLGLEYTVIVSMHAKSQCSLSQGILDGNHPKVLYSAEELRNDIILKWFENGLQKPLGNGFELFEDKQWTRGDLLIMEASNVPQLCSGDIPKQPEERLALQMKYLKYMNSSRGHKAWGGQPEYTAFAIIAKLTIEIWALESDGRFIKQHEFIPEESTGKIKLLFSGSNHYDFLLDDEEAELIRKIMPQVKLKYN